jgi:hypothetical protein
MARTKPKKRGQPQKSPWSGNVPSDVPSNVPRKKAKKTDNSAAVAASCACGPHPRGKRKDVPTDADYEPHRGRSKRSPTDIDDRSHRSSKTETPPKDMLGFINPDHIARDVFDEDIVDKTGEEDGAGSRTTKSRTPIAILHHFIQRSAERANRMENCLAGVYASLMSPSIADPENIPPAATAAAIGNAATTVVSSGRESDGAGEVREQLEFGIGDDKYVFEKNVQQYNKFGVIRSSINYDEDSAFEDEEPTFDMSYYRETGGRRGRQLSAGGPKQPDVSGMTKDHADAVLKLWRKDRKKYTDAKSTAAAKLRQSGENDGIEYLGVVTNLW